MDINIESGRQEYIDDYAALLAEGFKDDPLVLEQAGSDAEKALYAQFRAMIDAVYLRTGNIDVAYADDRLVGVALWLRPRDKHEPIVQRASTRLSQARTFIPHLPALLRALPPLRQLPRLISATRTIAEAVPRAPHWHLMDIAVSPDARGLSIGTRLLEHGLQRVDQEPYPAYLEASNARAAELYKRHGFGLLQTMTIGQADVFSMLRPLTQSRSGQEQE